MPRGLGASKALETADWRFARSAFDHLQPRPPARMPDIYERKQPRALQVSRRGLAKVYNGCIREGDGATREGEL